jgi:hypothetical protein
MESWTNTIRSTISKEKAKKPDPNSSLAEIECWRGKCATLSTLH